MADENQTTAHIFERLQAVRKEFAMTDVKKTGKGYGYAYFELGDFLHIAQAKFAEHGLCPVVSFPEPGLATLTLYDSYMTDEPILFKSPMAAPEMKGMNAAQAIGAAETYVRRYLYMTALELAEHSALEDDKNPKEIDVVKAEIGDIISSIKELDPTKRPMIAKLLKENAGTAVYTNLVAGQEEAAKAGRNALAGLLDKMTMGGEAA